MTARTPLAFLLITLICLTACGGSSDTDGNSAAEDASAATGPLAGAWVIDADATNTYHGGFPPLSDKERADFDAARFMFTGSEIKYSMYGKTGEVPYTVESEDEQSVILKTDEGRSLRFIKRPDGTVVMPADPRWAIVVIKSAS